MRTVKGKPFTARTKKDPSQQQKTAVYHAGGLHHWKRRVIREMQQSPRVQAKVVAGVFDRYLEHPQTSKK